MRRWVDPGFPGQTTFGYRRLWALLRYRKGLTVNRKAVYRVLKHKGWLVHQRTVTPRPRVQGRRSMAPRSNARWAIDVTHIPCGRDLVLCGLIVSFMPGTYGYAENSSTRSPYGVLLRTLRTKPLPDTLP